MFTRWPFGRLVVLLLAFILASPAAAAHAQGQAREDSEFYFEGDDGDVVFSNATLGFVDAGYGNLIAVLTVTPTHKEIDILLHDGWSHVDFEFHFRGIEPSGEGTYFAPAVTDYARQAGARIEIDGDSVSYYAMGLNIEKRWIAGEPLTVYAPISGFEPSGDRRPSVSVEAISSKWWFPEADDDCEIVFERTTNEVTLQYCTVQDSDSGANLYDEYGDMRFSLNN